MLVRQTVHRTDVSLLKVATNRGVPYRNGDGGGQCALCVPRSSRLEAISKLKVEHVRLLATVC